MRTKIGRRVLLAAVAGLFLLGGAACRSGSAAGEEQGGIKVYTGRIKSGFMGAGGEHTGWMLLRGGKGEADLEADVSAVLVRAKELDGTQVKASGTIVEKDYVERGKVPIFKIESLAPAPGSER